MKQIFILITVGLLTTAACKKDHNTTVTVKKVSFTNILILGNSITYAPANPVGGWNGNWGMAASAAGKDYVHLLAAKFKQGNVNTTVQAKNIAAFEVENSTYDFDKELKAYRDSKPDLLIMRISENVPLGFDSASFAKQYQALLAYMKVGNSNLKILAAGSFWSGHERSDMILSQYTPYVSLSFLGNDVSNYAFDMQNASDGVKLHPGDKGMQRIAETIWTQVEGLDK